MLGVELCGTKLDSPLISASGILDEHAESMIRLLDAGASAVTTKSIGNMERKGNENPVIAEVACGLLNGMGLPNPGIERFAGEMEIVKRKRANSVIIGSVFASSAEDFAILAKRMESYGASAVELNLSCPHAKGFGAEVGSDPQTVFDITKEVKKRVSIPVFVKLTPNVRSIVDLAKACEEAKADGITAINTVRGMKIDVDSFHPVLSCRVGGLSGPAIKPIGVRCVYEIAEEVDLPVIGVGGIVDGKDVIEYMAAGASAVGIGSGVYYRGLEIFELVRGEMEEFLREKKIGIEDIKGIAHRR
ncbi:MAG: dihydroorotate dehydrogenase [Candidatus Thermoplasmatota archaeon]|nr:dihydroorotate dehydrogenase [Candidatus Thermoplasmatota archaeon]